VAENCKPTEQNKNKLKRAANSLLSVIRRWIVLHIFASNAKANLTTEKQQGACIKKQATLTLWLQSASERAKAHF